MKDTFQEVSDGLYAIGFCADIWVVHISRFERERFDVGMGEARVSSNRDTCVAEIDGPLLLLRCSTVATDLPLLQSKGVHETF